MGTDATPAGAAIERLVRAFQRSGLPPVRPPADPGPVLAELDAELLPLRLPEQVRAFWSRVDPATLTVTPYPAPVDPALALQLWRSHRDEYPGMTPRLLLPVCCESQGFLLVELAGPGGPGGACFGWAYAGSPFTLRHPDLASYLDLYAALVEDGQFERRDAGGRPWYVFDPDERWDDAVRVRLPAAAPVPPYGLRREFEEDIRHWPKHWLDSEGPTAADRRPLGADATIEGLTARASATRVPVQGRIHARVVALSGSAAGRRASVADATGVLDVWCPAAVCTFGPVMDRSFEFDLVVQPDGEPGAVLPGPVAEPAQDGDLTDEVDDSRALTDRLYAELFETSRGAEASAVRPLD